MATRIENEDETSVDRSAAERAERSLLVESSEDTGDGFHKQVEKTLEETQEAVLGFVGVSRQDPVAQSWERARKVVHEFKPVPGIIWRLANYVLGRSGPVNVVTDGLVFGMRRLLFAAASDSVLGVGRKVNSTSEALQVLDSSVVAATSVIHAICRRLNSKPHERIWRPILDDAVLRAEIGYHVGKSFEEFGPGRGMLAGFAGRIGLGILIASGTLEEAQEALEMLASGKEIKTTALKVYDCDPLQISAMTLTAAGCGRDAAFGTVSFAASEPLSTIENEDQMKWLAAFTLSEKIRMGDHQSVQDELWDALNFVEEGDKARLINASKTLIREGHTLNWIF